FDRTGTYLPQWGTTGNGNGQFNGLFGVGVDAAGNVYTTEFNGNRIQKFSGAGVGVTSSTAPLVYRLQFGSTGSGPGQFVRPSGVATNALGNVYVINSCCGQIERFTALGQYLGTFGSAGTGDGKF